MKNEALTVIIPTYNSERYVERFISCLENQSFKNFNVLIIDDGSTDNTVDILERCKSDNLNIRLIKQDENRGVSHSRNLGIIETKTPYLTFMDADDWIDINVYGNCMPYCNNNVDIIMYGLSYDYLNINAIQKKYVYKKDMTITGDYALKIYGHTIHDELEITPIVNNKIYRTDFLKKYNILFNENTRYQEDDIFTFKALLCAGTVSFVSSCFYHYLQNEISAIHQVSDISINHFVEAYRSLEQFLKDNSLFEKYQNEFYLKMKASLKGVIKRTVEYGESPSVIRHLLVSLYKQLLDKFDIEQFLAYCDLNII